MADGTINRGIPGLSPQDGLEVLARTARRSEAGKAPLHSLVARYLPVCPGDILQAAIVNGPVVAEAIRAGVEDCEDAAVLDGVYERLPTLTSVLGEVALEVSRKRLSHRNKLKERLGAEVDFALRLRNLSRLDEAAQVMERVVKDVRTLPSAPHLLAVSLLNQGTIEADRRNYEVALAATSESVEIFESLAVGEDAQDPAAPVNLAEALTNLGARLNMLDRHEDALKALIRAQQLLAPAMDEDADGALPAVATALLNTANTLVALKRFEDAVDQSLGAISAFRILSQHNADAFDPGLADAYFNHALLCELMGQRDDALLHARMGVQIRRRITGISVQAYGKSAVAALNNLGLLMWEHGLREDAIDAVREEISLLAEVGGLGAAERMKRTAMKLGHLAKMLLAVGREDEALVAAGDGLKLIAGAEMDEWAHEYRMVTRIKFAHCLDALGRGEDALAAVSAATSEYEELDQEFDPDILEPLIRGYCLQARLHLAAGNMDQAFHAALNAGLIARDMEDESDEDRALRAQIIDNLARILDSMGDHDHAAFVRSHGLGCLMLADERE